MPEIKPSPGDHTTPWKLRISRWLDLLYPPRCASCDDTLHLGRSLCASCEASLPILTEPFCQSCGEPFEGKIDDTFDCPNCNKINFAFTFARPAFSRDDSLLQIIHQLKYGRQIHLATELGRLTTSAFTDLRLAPALTENWPLIPVPLHPKRQRQRHFNQAEEISRGISKNLRLPIVKALKRLKNTTTQTQLSRRERQNNLKDAFHLTRSGHRLLTSKPNGIILVDDVLTTGSTMDACAKTLRKAGFKNIVAVTVMRG